jgi:hypothetical protein
LLNVVLLRNTKSSIAFTIPNIANDQVLHWKKAKEFEAQTKRQSEGKAKAETSVAHE